MPRPRGRPAAVIPSESTPSKRQDPGTEPDEKVARSTPWCSQGVLRVTEGEIGSETSLVGGRERPPHDLGMGTDEEIGQR